MTLIAINLLPPELRPQAGSRGAGLGGLSMDAEAKKPLLIGLVVALFACALPFGLQAFWLDPRLQAVVDEEQRLEAEKQKYNTNLQTLNALEQQRDVLKQQLELLTRVAGGGASWGTVLNELRGLTPASLWLEGFTIDPTLGAVTLKGGALDYEAVAFLQRNLQTSEFFLHPVLTRTERREGSTNGMSSVTFELKADIDRTKL